MSEPRRAAPRWYPRFLLALLALALAIGFWPREREASPSTDDRRVVDGGNGSRQSPSSGQAKDDDRPGARPDDRAERIEQMDQQAWVSLAFAETALETLRRNSPDQTWAQAEHDRLAEALASLFEELLAEIAERVEEHGDTEHNRLAVEFDAQRTRVNELSKLVRTIERTRNDKRRWKAMDRSIEALRRNIGTRRLERAQNPGKYAPRPRPNLEKRKYDVSPG